MQEDYQQDSERYLFVVVVVLISFILFYFILFYLKEVRKLFKDLDLCLLKLKKEKTHSQVVLSVAAKCFYA